MVNVNSIGSQITVSLTILAFTLVTLPSILNWQTNLVQVINWAIWSILSLMLFSAPLGTNISAEWLRVVTLGQKSGPERIDGPSLFIPVTRMSFLQFSAVSWVHLWPVGYQDYSVVYCFLLYHTINTPVTNMWGRNTSRTRGKGCAVKKGKIERMRNWTFFWHQSELRNKRWFSTWNTR